MGRAVHADTPASGLKDGVQEGGDGPFAIGARHLNGWEAPFGMAASGQGGPHAL
jgi:hypothetical protein